MNQQLANPDVTVITGAGGWLGTGLVAAFLSDDHEYQRAGRLRLLVRDPADAVALRAASDRVEVVVGDISRADTARDLFRGLHQTEAAGSVDVIHTAGIIHPNKMADFDAVNHQGTEHVLRAAESAGVRRMVHVSSNSPFGTNADVADTFGRDEPFHPYFGYGRSKMDAELRVQDAVDRGAERRDGSPTPGSTVRTSRLVRPRSSHWFAQAGSRCSVEAISADRWSSSTT